MAAVALVMALVPAPVAPSAAPELVALGDSYAAGLGAGEESSDDCRQSPHAYPRLYAARTGASVVFAACSAATTSEVTRQASRITAATSLVTITVGGNDAGFKEVMTTCTLDTDDACEQRVATAEKFVREELPGRLDGLYGAVRSRTSAKVVVVGYPRLFSFDSWCLVSGRKREALNRAVDVLTEVVSGRVKAAGFVFADVRGAFDGHGACGEEPWVNGLVLKPVDRSYHPNRAGHESGYLPALAAAAG